MKHIIKRFDPISFGLNVAMVLMILAFSTLLLAYILGLIIGGLASEGTFIGLFGVMSDLGIIGIIVGPILYGIFGFIFGSFGAVAYNSVARITGGIKLTLDHKEMVD